MQNDKLPDHIERELSMLGVKPTEQPVVQLNQTSAYEYRKPVFDENGEPDF